MTNPTQELMNWLTWIGVQHPAAIDLSLERVAEVGQRLQLLQFSCPVITVGGTNGKGSTVATLAAIYQAAGYRVGLYTSPHLLKYNERIAMNGEIISDAALCAAFAAVEEARQGVLLTYFEFSTLAALYAFQQNNLDIIILEVGLGGRLDAVNVVESDIAIITTVDLDHTDWLGETREQIGYEKAGIFRDNKPAIYGDAEPVSSIIEVAAAKKTTLYLSGREFSYHDQNDHWQWQNSDSHYDNLPKPKVLLNNAALALQAIALLQACCPVSSAAIIQGLKDVTILGRFQVIQNNPRCIVDIAHNPQASQMLLQQITQLGWQGQLHIVFSMLSTKDMVASLIPWQHCPAQWYVAELSEAKAASLDAILENNGD